MLLFFQILWSVSNFARFYLVSVTVDCTRQSINPFRIIYSILLGQCLYLLFVQLIWLGQQLINRASITEEVAAAWDDAEAAG